MNASFADHRNIADARALRFLWRHADLQRWMGDGVPADEDVEFLLSEWRSGNAVAWLLYGEEGVPVAYIYAIEGEDPRYMGIHIGATKKARGRMMATFTKACLDHFRVVSPREYTLEGEISVNNPAAIAFAKKFGFEEFHRDEKLVTLRRELR